MTNGTNVYTFAPVIVDHGQIDWHEVIAEYLKFSELGKDFKHYMKHPESFHYPLTGANNTERARDDSPNWNYSKPILVKPGETPS